MKQLLAIALIFSSSTSFALPDFYFLFGKDREDKTGEVVHIYEREMNKERFKHHRQFVLNYFEISSDEELYGKVKELAETQLNTIKTIKNDYCYINTKDHSRGAKLVSATVKDQDKNTIYDTNTETELPKSGKHFLKQLFTPYPNSKVVIKNIQPGFYGNEVEIIIDVENEVLRDTSHAILSFNIIMASKNTYWIRSIKAEHTYNIEHRIIKNTDISCRF